MEGTMGKILLLVHVRIIILTLCNSKLSFIPFILPILWWG